MLNFLPRAIQPSLDSFFRILAAGTQSPLELLPRRRQNKDTHRSRQFLLHLPGALHIDFEHQV